MPPQCKAHMSSDAISPSKLDTLHSTTTFFWLAVGTLNLWLVAYSFTRQDPAGSISSQDHITLPEQGDLIELIVLLVWVPYDCFGFPNGPKL